MRRNQCVGQTIAMLVAGSLLAAAHAEDVKIPAPHIGEEKTLRAQWFKPSADKATGAAAILLHGCGGLGANRKLNARHAAAKDWLLERGIAVVFPESFTSRRFEEVCTVKMQARTIRQIDRVEDVMAAHRWLREQPGVDAKKIVLWGWSHGGSTVLNTITHKSATLDRQSAPGDFSDDVKFVEAIAFYPGCSPFAKDNAPAKISSPLTILIGEADDWTPAAPCRTLAQQLPQSIQIEVYPGAFHGFDGTTPVRLRRDVPNGVNPGAGVHIGAQPAAREAAAVALDAFLRSRWSLQ